MHGNSYLPTFAQLPLVFQNPGILLNGSAHLEVFRHRHERGENTGPEIAETTNPGIVETDVLEKDAKVEVGAYASKLSQSDCLHFVS